MTLEQLLTEQVDDRYAAIDTAPVAELARLMNEADSSVPAAVRRAFPQIVPAIEAVTERLAGGGRLLYIGAGSAGRMGVLDAAENSLAVIESNKHHEAAKFITQSEHQRSLAAMYINEKKLASLPADLQKIVTAARIIAGGGSFPRQ